MKGKILFLAVMVIMILLPQVLAQEQTLKFNIEIKNGNPDSWTSYQRQFNTTDDQVSIGGFSFQLIDYDTNSNPQTAIMQIAGTNELLAKGTTYCIINEGKKKDENNVCTSDSPNATINTIRITLNSIAEKTTATVYNSSLTVDNPIYAYVFTDKELPINKNDIRTYDAKVYNQQPGWTSSAAQTEVDVYFQRREGLPISITVTSPGNTSVPREEWTSDRVKYLITANGKYTFNVQYDKYNFWGAKTTQTDTYGLIVTGLAGTVSLGSKSVHRVYVPDTIDLEMTADGTFEQVSGVTIAPLGGTKYRFTIPNAGYYKVPYHSSEGDTVEEFDVRPLPVPPQQPQPAAPQQTVSANQQPGTNSEEGGLGIPIWGYIGGIAVLLIGIVLVTRKKSNNTPFRQPTKFKQED